MCVVVCTVCIVSCIISVCVHWSGYLGNQWIPFSSDPVAAGNSKSDGWPPLILCSRTQTIMHIQHTVQ